MSDTREVLHDDNPGDVHAWQPVATLATALGIAERTVRARLAAGTVERCPGPGGRSYYRVPATSSAPSAADSNDGTTGSRQLAAAELFALIREHGSRNERLALELGQARATVEQLERVRRVDAETVLANRQALEREQATAALLVHELAQARAQVEHERQRTAAFVAQVEAERMAEQARAARLERLAQAPWYAVRERKRLRRELASA